ncbi:hypothetical protein FSP39_008159 [Pinctada imbricata]|uniref:Integral membrane protein GPR175 n=1 Tax=Pinctada imbricata TaxID=66713 RepID=A0AA89C6Z7_PINIB|nr:hypothetical protein FSP39_008159 [Pinctada imbricata]
MSGSSIKQFSQHLGSSLKSSNIFHENGVGEDNSVKNSTLLFSDPIKHQNGSSIPIPSFTISEPVCQAILYDDIGNSRVRVWDLIILIPNTIFLLFLLWKSRSAITKLRSTSSPIFTAFYALVCLVAVISVLRCIVAMTVNASVLAGDIADKVLWLILRFFLLATELSIVIFGLAFGHLDSYKSIQRVLFITCCISLVYSGTQGTLEFEYPDPQFHVKKSSANDTDLNFDIFGHGGMIFWLTSSLFFFAAYSVIIILPLTKLKEKLALPPKRSFYMYCAFLAFLNLMQAIGSGMLYGEVFEGMCLVDATSYLYFTCFAPLVYLVFLRKFFREVQPGILFSYKNQIDEIPDEDVSMPYQSNNMPKADDTESISASYDSTHFDRQSGSYYTRSRGLLQQASINTADDDVMPPSPTSHYYQASA